MLKGKSILFVAVIFLLTGNYFAQSDYEKVEGFKQKVASLKVKINNAASISECGILSDSINALKDEYSTEKELLDEALYPEDFESTFHKLENDLKVRSVDLSVMTELSDEISAMKSYIQELTNENDSLINEITELQDKSEKDAAEISNLNALVKQLKNNITKRDKLVKSMIDSLLTEFVRSPTTLNEAEQQAIIGEIENKSLFYSVEKVVEDNISYIEVTEMKIPDFSEMLNEYETFSNSWNQLGTKLADVYLTRKERAKELAYINNLFADWNDALQGKIWRSINKNFIEKDIRLLPFGNGEEFTSSIITFINGEIENLSLKESEESEMTYDKFVYGVYLKTIQPEWIPFLIQKELMTTEQKSSIQSAIEKWEELLFPGPNLTWLFIIIGIVLLLQIWLYMKKRAQSGTTIKEIEK